MKINLNEIFEGFKNSIFKNEQVEKISEKRLKICFECPFRNENRCGKCGCFLNTKTRSLKSKCPENKW